MASPLLFSFVNTETRARGFMHIESLRQNQDHLDKISPSVAALKPVAKNAPPRPAVNKSDEVASLHSNAFLLMRNHLHHEAYVLMVRALQIDSNNYHSLQRMYDLCLGMKRYDEAKRLAQQLVKVRYQFDVVVQVAQIHYILGEDQRSLDSFLEALSILDHESPLLFDVYKSMGNIFVRLQDYDAAQEYYDKACTLRPESDVLFVNYGTLEIQRGEHDKALACFRDAVKLNARNSKAWVGMAMIHDLRADFELAWANAVQAFDFDLDNKTALMLIYQWGKRDGHETIAINYLMKYLCAHESDEEVSLWLTHLYLSLGRYHDARMEVEKILLFNSEHKEAQEIMFVLSERKFFL